MISFAIALFIVIAAIIAITRSAKHEASGRSLRAIFEKMHKLLYDENIQNEQLDDRLRLMLRKNENYRAFTQRYGISASDPIRVNGPIGEQLYIAMLRGIDGQLVIGHRLGSLKNLDVYEVVSSDFSHWAILFFDMYYLTKDTVAPDGFVIDTSGTRTLTSVNKFMAYFPCNFYSELSENVAQQIGFPLVNTLLSELQPEGVARPSAHQDLINNIVVMFRAEGIGMDT